MENTINHSFGAMEVTTLIFLVKIKLRNGGYRLQTCDFFLTKTGSGIMGYPHPPHPALQKKFHNIVFDGLHYAPC